jgi:Dyp-type peroxidase family
MKMNETDIQGILKRAYKELPETFYVMLQIRDPLLTKKWIGSIVSEITPAAKRISQVDRCALHIGFTFEGIRKLIPLQNMEEPFSREFVEGIRTDQRSRILGDIESNSPDHWQWNGKNDDEVHVVLMIFARNKSVLKEEYERHTQNFSAACRQVVCLDTTTATGEKEHFGFRDGISQPRLKGFEGSKKTAIDELNNLEPGEFIFGYKNEYGKLPLSPMVNLADGQKFNLGLNGSYMVFRQLEQDVRAFWKYMYETAATDPDFRGPDEGAVYLASKMMGRWPNGNPLHLAKGPDEKVLADDKINRFLFKGDGDPEGFGCPIGSHIRKSNPRDGIDTDPVTSIAVSKRHRILRRGRPYGEPLSKTLDPKEVLRSEKEAKAGLYFICFNTNIGRQFEFIQHTWNNNPKFDGLYNDIDPVIGFPFLAKGYPDAGAEFTIQACPVRKKVKGIPQFVFVKGGAYFFLPGIKALGFLSGDEPTG